jgi:hypothetical protein
MQRNIYIYIYLFIFVVVVVILDYGPVLRKDHLIKMSRTSGLNGSMVLVEKYVGVRSFRKQL